MCKHQYIPLVVAYDYKKDEEGNKSNEICCGTTQSAICVICKEVVEFIKKDAEHS